ncbi:hypothetical protein GKA01_11500 [Gluconobacter kanchanaburiensis NBRC 103587]|uniref:Uncharacterized protein n=1 Tax=Gluconobacter kanchanaburiensis NBRC 103587 TaxID=1307948 RepID=A0A511B8E8_9PROT|nr:hypothetical protein AA103587_2111 [Gluconobacter kanchanaburiensis NBRC 103587]GEK95953.1 hypothetical protein GKA01_11500 [Gluconobacter kanchanaburiensis NBRC 103587]
MGGDLSSVIGRQRHDQSVQKAPSATGAILKKTVHLRCQPDTGEALAYTRVGTDIFAIKLKDPAWSVCRCISGADLELLQT